MVVVAAGIDVPSENPVCGVLVVGREKLVAVAGAVVVKPRENPAVVAAAVDGTENPVDNPAKLGAEPKKKPLTSFFMPLNAYWK